MPKNVSCVRSAVRLTLELADVLGVKPQIGDE